MSYMLKDNQSSNQFTKNCKLSNQLLCQKNICLKLLLEFEQSLSCCLDGCFNYLVVFFLLQEIYCFLNRRHKKKNQLQKIRKIFGWKAFSNKVFLPDFYVAIDVLLYFIMRITQMPGIFVQKKNRSVDEMLETQKPKILGRNSASYQLNALLTFKKSSKIGKKELLHMLGKKNSVFSGTFTIDNNKVLVIAESKQVQKPITSFRKKIVKTINKSQTQNQPKPSIREEINISSQRRHNVNFDFIKKYFSKHHLFNDQKDQSRQEKPLKGLKLIINDKNLQQIGVKQGEDWRMKRLDKHKGKVEFINNFMRTRYKTVHNHKEGNQNVQANTTNSVVFLGRYSQRRNNSIFTPWEKKEQYDQFEI